MKKHRLIIVYLLAYFIINLLFLTRFPFVHSDEPWLSGLTRNMAQTGSVSVTETFFDLKPRYPHAIKTLFHLLQMPFMALFGYELFAFRLMSLLFGILALVLFYIIVSGSLSRQSFAFIGTIIVSLDIQFIYASHFARPEIIILCAMLGVYALLTSKLKQSALIAGVITGISIGIHPNSFLVAALGGALIVSKGIEIKRVNWLDLGTYSGATAAFCAVFVAMSFSFDSDFIRHYIAYGSEFEVDSSLAAKLREILPYFERLYYGVSGTYYTPDIRPQLVAFPIIVIAGAFACLRLRESRFLHPLAAIAGILLGMTVIGRFSQPYVVFFFPFAYIALLMLTDILPERFSAYKGFALRALCVLSCALSLAGIVPVLKQGTRYEDYLSQIAYAIPSNAKTIGNLNVEYHFDNGSLLDYRNLTYLKAQGLSLEEYIEQRGVEYLIISDELDFIYEIRPVWNGIYGNINFLNELEDYLSRRCTLVHSFTDNQYGIRIVRYQNTDRDFTVRIYRRND